MGRSQGEQRRRNGSKVRVGVAVSGFVGGSTGFDGLFIIKPDGQMYVHTGIGNLGTESMIDCQLVAAEMVGMPWEKTHVTWATRRSTFRGAAFPAVARRFMRIRAPRTRRPATRF